MDRSPSRPLPPGVSLAALLCLSQTLGGRLGLGGFVFSCCFLILRAAFFHSLLFQGCVVLLSLLYLSQIFSIFPPELTPVLHG